MTMRLCRKQDALEENEAEEILALKEQMERDRAHKAQQANKDDESQRKWILQYMEQGASDGGSSDVSPDSCKEI